MNKNILLLSSSFPLNLFKQEIEKVLNSDQESHLTLIFKEEHWKESNFNMIHENLDFINIKEFENSAQELTINKDLSSVIHKIIYDPNTFLMFDRVSYHKNYIFGVKNYLDDISISVYHIYDFLKKLNPDIIFLRTTPHSILEWIFVHIGEYMGIKILMCENTILPWRYKLVNGFLRNRIIILPKKKSLLNDKYVQSYIKKTSGDYNQGIPNYEKIKLKANRGKIYNPIIDFIKWYKNPVFLINKYRCFNRLNVLSVSETVKTKYVIFFLHYQPERTTVPEGYEYSSQLIAIQKLRALLPDSVILYVKEHPSIFTNKCDPRQRIPEFYNKICQLQNTKLININKSSYDLIDNALLTATITGTVGVESLIRGIPTLFFGKSLVKKGFGVFLVSEDSINLKKFINDCCDKKLNNLSIKKEIINQINLLPNETINGLSDKCDINDYTSNRDFGHTQILKNLIEDNYKL